MNMVPSSCIFCGTNIMVNSAEFGEMKTHICATCTQYRTPYTSSQVTATTRDLKEFEEELEAILSNEELDFDDLTDWEVSTPECECGAEKVGITYHARWCPIYIDPMASKKEEGDYDR